MEDYNVDFIDSDVDFGNISSYREFLKKTIIKAKFGRFAGSVSNFPTKIYVDNKVYAEFDWGCDVTEQIMYIDREFTNESDWNNWTYGRHAIHVEFTTHNSGWIEQPTHYFTKVPPNTPPTISDSDRDLGGFSSSPQIPYTIENDDAESITEKIDNITLWTTTNVSGDKSYSTSQLQMSDWNNLSYGQHALTITVTDSAGQSAVRTYTFTKIAPPNSSPTISDSDKNLGDKNTGFSIAYKINDSDNDNLTVTESLNNTTLKTLNNAPKNTNLEINITDEMLYKLPLNTENKISICADDGKGGVSYRNYTFKRTNTAPIISGEDKDLATVTRDITEKYTVVDQENNKITVTEKVDDITIKTFTAEPNKEYVISIPTELWVTLTNGQHKLTINATDSNNATSIRTYTFIKKENKIILDIKKPFETDAKANKILITPVWQIENATVKVETCNNALDTNPSWEDATKEVLANKKYEFKNTNKTGEKWGINIRFTIIKKDGAKDMVLFNGFGGAFE